MRTTILIGFENSDIKGSDVSGGFGGGCWVRMNRKVYEINLN